MSEALLIELLDKVEQLTPAEQKRLARHAEWLSGMPQLKNKVGHRLEDILAYAETIVRIVEKHGATNARLYGSTVRGESRPDSDVDIVVDLSGKKLGAWFPAGLNVELSELLGRRVDVVTFDGLIEPAKAAVLKEAIPLCAQMPSASMTS